MYVLLVALAGLALSLKSFGRIDNTALTCVFFLAALGGPILYINYRRDRSGIDANSADTEAPRSLGRGWVRYILLLFGGAAVFVLIDFTIDFGRLPTLTELSLNTFDRAVDSHSALRNSRYYTFDKTGHLQRSTGPLATDRQANSMNTAATGMGRLDQTNGGHPASSTLPNASSNWVLFSGTDPHTRHRILHARLHAEPATIAALLDVQNDSDASSSADEYRVQFLLADGTGCFHDVQAEAVVRIDSQAPLRLTATRERSNGGCLLTVDDGHAFVAALSGSRMLWLSQSDAGANPMQIGFRVNGFTPE